MVAHLSKNSSLSTPTTKHKNKPHQHSSLTTHNTPPETPQKKAPGDCYLIPERYPLKYSCSPATPGEQSKRKLVNPKKNLQNFLAKNILLFN